MDGILEIHDVALSKEFKIHCLQLRAPAHDVTKRTAKEEIGHYLDKIPKCVHIWRKIRFKDEELFAQSRNYGQGHTMEDALLHDSTPKIPHIHTDILEK